MPITYSAQALTQRHAAPVKREPPVNVLSVAAKAAWERRRAVTKERDARYTEMWNAGKPIARIAKAFGWKSVSSVTLTAKRLGLKRRQRGRK